ncbi:MAG: porin family protein [Terracidiphilus sp.]
MKTFVKNAVPGLCIAALFLLVMSAPAWAQVLAHTGEVAGTIGYDHTSFNPSTEAPTTTHFFSGSGGYNITPYITTLGEYKYDPLNSASGDTDTYHTQFYGGAVRFNFTPSQKIVPYAVVGVGDYRFTTNKNDIVNSYNGYYVNFGGGASVYFGKHWGVRPELRYERQHVTSGSQSLTGNVVDISGSIFYQFGGTGKKKK